MTKFWLNYGTSGRKIIVDEDDNVLMHTKCPCCPCARCENASLPSIDVTFAGFEDGSLGNCAQLNETFTADCAYAVGRCVWRIDPNVDRYDLLEVKLTLFDNLGSLDTLIEVSLSSDAGQSVTFLKVISGDAQQDCCAWENYAINTSISVTGTDCDVASGPATCTITANCCAPPD